MRGNWIQLLEYSTVVCETDVVSKVGRYLRLGNLEMNNLALYLA